MLKIYPTVVTKDSLIYRWWQQKKYQPYSDQILLKTLTAIKKIIPYYVRISRLIRDIPAESIKAGSKISNLRQFLQHKMQKEKISCKCIRCREARQKQINIKQARLFIEKYQASDGTEYFLSYEDKSRKTLYAFLRLRIPFGEVLPPSYARHPCLASDARHPASLYQLLPELKNAALIREVHTYGQLVSLGFKTQASQPGKIQHEGFGKKLMREAEKIARQQGCKKMAVIAGIGVREYYRKLGYQLDGEYMVKTVF
jgi:elongator complex protein 3